MSSIGCMIENDSKPSPARPAISALPADVAAIQAGGWGAWTVRAALAEMVLAVPCRVEAEAVGEPDLFDRVPVGPLFAVSLPPRMRAAPRLGHVDLVQQVELHQNLQFVISNTSFDVKNTVTWSR